jgi:aryl-alcohol dehydrogenase-like predicted oxidoreductase
VLPKQPISLVSVAGVALASIARRAAICVLHLFITGKPCSICLLPAQAIATGAHKWGMIIERIAVFGHTNYRMKGDFLSRVKFLQTRKLGRSQIQVSAMGCGTNTIGGPVWEPDVRQNLPVGYGEVDQQEALRAIQRAVDLGITLFDTADEYGCGQSERLLGKALRGKRHQVVIASKFGYRFDEASRTITGSDASPAYIRQACEASLRRLNTSYIDLYQLHLRDYPLEAAGEVLQTLEELVAEGKIRYYGWSTDDPARASLFAQGKHCAAVQHRLNVLIDAPAMLAVCDQHDLASINRIPLLMGVLSGKFTPRTQLPEEDIRSEYFKHQQFNDDLKRVEALKDTLTACGHTLPQAALAWILARHPRTIPIPGFRTTRQVEENARTLELGPLSQEQMQRIEEILGRHPDE